MTKTLDLPQRYRHELLSLLEAHVPEAEVWAYGSRVKGTNHEGSDLDIVLRGPELQRLGSEYLDLLDAIEESTIPILVDVFDWARLPESFHSEIERGHVVLRQSERSRRHQIASPGNQTNAAIDVDPSDRQTVMQMLARHVPYCEVRAYGSRVQFTSEQYSPLDITVLGTVEQSSLQLIHLRKAFEQSNLPFRVSVLAWDTAPDTLREEIERNCAVLQRAVPPNEWHRSTLGECTTINDDQRSAKEEWPPFIHYLDTGSIIDGQIDRIQRLTPTVDKIPSRARRQCRSGDIVYSTVRPDQRHYGIITDLPENFVVSTGFAVVRAKQEIVDPGFVYRYLTQDHIVGHLQALAEHSTSAYPSIRPADLANLKIAFPSLGEQRRIAEVLGAFDHRIELNRRMCETLEKMAQALYKSWFVDFEPVRAKMEGRWQEGESLLGLPAEFYHLFPDELVDSQLGPIPRGWRICRLGEAADHSRQTVDPSRSPELEYCHYSIPAFDSGKRPVAQPGKAILSNKCVVHPNTVLLSRLNPDVERVWLVGPEPGEAAIASTEFAVLCPKPPIDSAFLYCTLRSDRYRNALVGLVTGTSKSHQRVRPQALAATTLLMPPQEVLAEFSVGVSQWLRQTLELRSASQCLTEIRDKLLPKLISGEVRIGGSQQMAGAIGC